MVNAPWYRLVGPMLETNSKISEMSKIKMHSTKLDIHSECLLHISHIYLVSAVVYFSYLFDKSVPAEVPEEEVQKRNT